MDFKKLETMLKKFDWTYAFSDDNRNYNAGERSKAELKKVLLAMMIVDFKKTKELYKKHKTKYGVNFDKLFL